MQAAGTLCGTRAISLLALLIPLIGYAYSIPLQYLPSIPGYIPVYIRHGDEPLVNINPDLAEAFGETSNSAKNSQLDLAHVSDSFKDNDIDALLEESNRQHDYPLRVRAAESRSFANINDNASANKPKLLNIYRLPDDDDSRPRRRYRGRTRTVSRDNESRPRRRYRGRSRTKSGRTPAPAFKIAVPLSDAEKEELKKLAIEVEKEETKPNELYVPNSKHAHPDLPSEMGHNRHKAHKSAQSFAVPLKVQNPLDESSIGLVKLSQDANPSKLGTAQNAATSESDKKEPSSEKQRSVSSNADKMPRIDLLKESKNCGDATSKAGKEVQPIKVQHPATLLSNVDKLSPIDLPDNKSKTNEDNKAKDSAKPNDEIAME